MRTLPLLGSLVCAVVNVIGYTIPAVVGVDSYFCVLGPGCGPTSRSSTRRSTAIR